MVGISSVETKKDRKAAQAHADEHFEHMSAKARLMDINRKRTQRKIENLETQLAKEHVNLDELKKLAWTGIPPSKQ